MRTRRGWRSPSGATDASPASARFCARPSWTSWRSSSTYSRGSFVGPRPEVERYVRLYTPYQRQVLLVRPGITDYASIAYRNENDLLAGAKDPEKMYIEQIMPDKIELNMKYLREISPLADIKLILKTIAAVVKG